MASQLSGSGICYVYLAESRSRQYGSLPGMCDYGAILSAPRRNFEKFLNDFEAASPTEVDGMTPHQEKVICRFSFAHAGGPAARQSADMEPISACTYRHSNKR